MHLGACPQGSGITFTQKEETFLILGHHQFASYKDSTIDVTFIFFSNPGV
jgi:hypothetical protein